MSNKMAKGAIAVGAGVVLLLGGAGTYAWWSVSEPMKGTIESGNLYLEVGEASWTRGDGTAFDPTYEHIVPGDEVVLTQELMIAVVGETLQAELSVSDAEALVEGTNQDLVDHLTVDFALDKPTSAGWAPSQPGSYSVPSHEEGSPHTAEATVAIQFDGEGPEGRTGTQEVVDLSKLQFTLSQVDPAETEPAA